MEDLSLHVLDIVQNSVKAGARLVRISLVEDKRQDRLTLMVEDDGSGMDPDVLTKVTDPFFTTRTTRKVGLGLPFLKAAAIASDGDMKIESKPGAGTRVEAVFGYAHIDRPPIGKMDETLATLIVCNPDIDIAYRHGTETGEYILDTIEMRRTLGAVPLNTPAVVDWVRADVAEGLDDIGASSY
jgi:anti-sigma regulatory factor (Ser/Thr protein kinase)